MKYTSGFTIIKYPILIKSILNYTKVIATMAIISICHSQSLFASTPIKFQHISVSEGLKNSRVVSILQDKFGYMWFATHNGLEKFNGSEIQHYSIAYDTTFYAQDNIINCIKPSKDFDILCGTKSGNVYYYHRKQDQFISLFPETQNDELFNITSLYADNGKGVWIGTSGSLFYYSNSDKMLTQISDIRTGVADIVHAGDDYLWLATSNGLILLDKKSHKRVALNHKHQQTLAIESEDIFKLYSSQHNRLTICTKNAKIFNIDYHNNDVSLINYKQFNFKEKEYPIRDFISSPNGENAIAFDGIGLVITDSLLNLKHIYSSNDDDPSSLSSNGVYQLYYSYDSILWVATYGGGINYYDPNHKPFETIKHIPFVDNSLRNNTVNAIIEDKDGKIWYGTKKGISIYNNKTKQWKHIPELHKIASHPIHIMQMEIDTQGNIWVATYGNGLIKLDYKTYTAEHFTTEKSDYHHTETNYLYHLIKDNKNRIWTGGIWGGVSVIDPENKISKKINVTNVRCFYDDENHVLIGTLFGLFLVNKHSLEVSRPKPQELIRSRIITISKHPNKNIYYFGTDLKGIIVWDKDHHSIKHLTTTNGLPANYIRSVIWDQTNKMWVGTTAGLCTFDQQDSIISNYLPIDGISNTEFSENAVCKLKDNKLIFGGIDGVTLFYPEKITLSKQISTPIFTGIKLSGETLTITKNGPLTENINTQEKINLKYNQNSINISFSAIGYTTPKKIKYKWILEGLENKWNSVAGIKEAIYAKLPPGNYVFKVMSTNDDGVWQNYTKSIAISIAQPFWKTTWAYVLYMVVLAGLIYLIILYSQTILHEKHHIEKQQFFTSIAHDLRTPLALIKLPIEKMINEESENKNLTLVKRNIDRLTNLVNQLLDFQKSDSHKMHLQVAEHNFSHFLKQRIKIFTPLSIEKNIELNYNKLDTEIKLWFDKGKMEKIMNNLLSNAIKYTPKNGKVDVEMFVENNKCFVSIKDNGEGIPKKQQKNIFQRYYRATNAINSLEVGSGVGLVLTKQLVELHHGHISFKSELGKGTCFSFYIPLGKKHYKKKNFIAEAQENTPYTPIVQIDETEQTFEQNTNKGMPTLLLVEDHPELLQSLAHELSNDYNILTAKNGEEGLALAKSKMPDIIVSDVMMPVMNGHQLCLKLKGDLSICHIPIILLTALDTVDYKQEGLEHGADAYMVKPFDLKMLIAQIKNLLKNRNMLKQKFLIPSSEASEVSPTNQDQKFLEKIQRYVIANLDNNELTVENTAKELGMSRPVLYRKIKALTDLSPQQFVMNIKLKEAARIMKMEDKNISETAFMVGFSDPKYFSQTFKKHFGLTPSQYLKQ